MRRAGNRGSATAVPRATVRLQLHAGFTLYDAAETVPYYAALGVSHFYVSPIQQARRGSTHGYDGTDPTRVDAERGGREGLRALAAALRAHAMGLIIDIVPNHLSSSLENPWWFDVLERGRASRYADFFAIDRQNPDPTLRDRVLAPFLAEDIDAMILRGAIGVRYDESLARFVIDADGTAYPFAADAYRDILGEIGPQFAAAFDHVSGADFDMGRKLLRDAACGSAGRAALDAYLVQIGRDERVLRRWLDAQHYVLCCWQDAPRRLNWRRFFDIAELIALRQEDETVREAFHALIFELYASGEIDGVRVDHIDGLADPAAYSRYLRHRFDELAPQRPVNASNGPAWIVVEKILGEDESLRQSWPVDGSTGYEFMDQVGALLHNADAEKTLDGAWHEAGGGDYSSIALGARREILTQAFESDFERLLRAARRALPGLDAADTRSALRRLLHGYPRYRGYARVGRPDPDDDAPMARAADAATDEGAEQHALASLVELFLGTAAMQDEQTADEAIVAFQQVCAPLAARAIEDTTFYRYVRLISRNEVGALPSTLAIDATAFHSRAGERASKWPHTLLATASHDHKRGEDARMRIASISDLAREWRQQAARWRERHREGDDAPDAIDLQMLYQTLIGAWPSGSCDRAAPEFRRRIAEWQVKAIRERKQHGSWVSPDSVYEEKALRFVERALDDPIFTREVSAFVRRIERAAALRGLVQTTLRCTSPGIPDLFQGTDFWDLSLVDPDNRRPVDHSIRERALASSASDRELLTEWHDGRVKQRLLRRLLSLRARYPECFAGAYRPIELNGPQRDAFLAYARSDSAGHRVIVVVPTRPTAVLGEGLCLDATRIGGTALAFSASDAWNVLSNRPVALSPSLPIAPMLDDWPVIVLAIDPDRAYELGQYDNKNRTKHI